jgi:hypothetical protein
MGEFIGSIVHEAARPAGVVLIAGALGAACLSMSGCTSSPGSEARGTVFCPSGEPVEGVWIDAGTGQGWAHWQLKSPNDPSTAEYSRDVGAPTNYGVDVGCAGTPRRWEHTDYARKSIPSDITAVWRCGPDTSKPLAVDGLCILVRKTPRATKVGS